MVNQSPDNDSETSIELEADAPVMHLSNAVRLSVREWIFVGLTVAFVLIGMPVLWSKVEPFELPADYRIPFSSSEDYWLYR
ncbi:MAG: hypothetical protein AB7O26_09915, partial [Planctomycetaceae bacterium]